MDEAYNNDFLVKYFELVQARATQENPLHRAKALRLVCEAEPKFKSLLRKQTRDKVWDELQKNNYLKVSEKDYYIVGLGQAAACFLK